MRNRFVRTAAGVAVCFLLIAPNGRPEGLGSGSAAALETVKTDLGQLAGAPPAGGVTAFLGVPYAAPPVGDLRWRPPQPAKPWTGVRKADQFGASCMQNEAGSRLPWTEEFMTQGPISEDCLFLNVWTAAPRANAKLPVMFWIYGGGFNEGSGQVAVYDGTALAKKGVIVVSVNYRVGPLGFFVHPELSQESEHHVSGNYGILDQIAALQWVHRNIAAFGGDPDRVTIFGQSAGALSVATLMKSPLAKGLFARAIAESGPGLLRANALGATTTLADREAAGAKYADARGASTLAQLRALPAASFFGSPGAAGRGGVAPPPNGPFKDGWVVPQTDPADQVPLMVGFVADDIGIGGANSTPDQKADARARARGNVDQFAAEQMKASRTVYTYYFDRVIPWPAHPEFGAFHTSEVPYVFNTILKIDRPWTAVDRTVADQVSSYWSNFAKTGNPNGPGLPAWPAYDPSAHVTMQLGERMGSMPVAAPTAR
jgi:para-nitrobenzyl esterase